MGRALTSVLGLKTNITGGAFEALTPGSGDSFNIFSYPQSSRAWLLEAWAGNSATKCQFSIRSPRMHDNVRGIRMAYMFNPTLSGADGDPQLLLPPYMRQPLYSSDTLTVEVSGTANDDVDLVQLHYYEDLPGVDADLASWEEVSARAVDAVGILVTPTAGATNDYGTSEALNTDDDRLKADTDYALIGITTDVPVTSIGIRGPNTGNLRIACPGHWNERQSGGFFVDISRMYGLALIPVINANNKGNTQIDAVASNGAVAPNVTLQFLELARG